jgi:hypothetical protein
LGTAYFGHGRAEDRPAVICFAQLEYLDGGGADVNAYDVSLFELKHRE